MAEISDPPEPGSKRTSAADNGRKQGREARLAEALRTNLRRRKDAARSAPKPSGRD